MSLFAKGFRPFFLLAAIFAAVFVPIWLVVLAGVVLPAGPLQGPVWHAHEMVHGFAGAVVAGFLLTAVGNWTSRETVTGTALAVLAAIWLAGRLALAFVPGWPASAIDLAFLPGLAIALARPLAASRDRRNAAFPVLVLLLWAANLAVHLDALGIVPGVAVQANRAAVYLLVVIILVVSGRVVPMFTRNATGAPVVSVRWLDWTATIAALALVVLQLVPGAGVAEPFVSAATALAIVGRAWDWGARYTLKDPLLWVLHAGHGWIAVGLGLDALSAFWPMARSLPIHALTVGAIGMLTLGMMARVSLGHTGRPIKAPRVMGPAFAALLVAAVARVFGPLLASAWTTAWLWVAGVLWTAAFATYVVVYAPMLVAPRVDGKRG